MPDPDLFHAQMIESGVRSIAAGAAEALLDARPDAHAFGQPAFPAWQEHLAGRLYELASAMRAGQPSLFAEQLHWARLAFEARGLDHAELVESIHALGESLETDLPDGAAAAVAPYLDAARQGLERGAGDAEPPALAGTHGTLASHYMLALLEGDRRRALGALDAALQQGLSPQDAMLGVLVPVAREVGRLWHLGEVAIGEEHFVTNTATLALGRIRASMTLGEPNGLGVLVGSVPGNRHDLAGRIVSLLLEQAGFRVVDLGAETPAGDLVQAAGDFEVDAIVLGVMLGTHLEGARRTIESVRRDERVGGVPVIVGGRVFDQADGLWEQLGADALARIIEDTPALVTSTIQSRRTVDS